MCLYGVLKSVFANKFGKSTKDRTMKIHTDVVLYEEQGARPKALDSVIIFGASLDDTAEFQRRLHGANLNLASSSDLFVIREDVVRSNSFPILYPYEFQCSLLDEVPETFAEVYTYSFHVRNA